MAARKSSTKLQTPHATKREKASFILNTESLGSFGQEMAQAATQQVSNASTYWDRCRTYFTEAQRNGKAAEALEAIFKPGENVKGKKAPWYRTYKSILGSAVALNLTVTDSMGMTALQKAIKIAKDEAADNDPKLKAEKDANALEMFKRMVVGCLNRGIPKSKLATILKDAEA